MLNLIEEFWGEIKQEVLKTPSAKSEIIAGRIEKTAKKIRKLLNILSINKLDISWHISIIKIISIFGICLLILLIPQNNPSLHCYSFKPVMQRFETFFPLLVM
ncbi:hypothetical protein BDC45DRAFT_235273 [Circinella umbellata]|nr:hypothetical protein BDC45DRAFT_235273 [Circinella umbellata]